MKKQPKSNDKSLKTCFTLEELQSSMCGHLLVNKTRWDLELQHVQDPIKHINCVFRFKMLLCVKCLFRNRTLKLQLLLSQTDVTHFLLDF